MNQKWRPPAARLACLLALVFSLGAGAAFAAGALRSPTRKVSPRPDLATPEFDSPRVTGLSVARARSVLNDHGYDVMVSGRGEVELQELGLKGQLLRIKGERSGPLRYCASSAERCLPVGS